ncbi:DoxX protein [Fictibacillus macauensis ZFHKF-1]|uniref:DoxX protein n=1 Tax=Fictibacillus macauensis ZFHKF-1 TaxID=1196324 RepID=I8AM36_9BACL|nr:DoxX family protein [Fictibacillus macauensis]EIT86729.1 DoxX protein [Fictibacillus macauensis ZFHKF-1]
MLRQFLRTNSVASVLLTVIRLYIGYQWLMAGWKKIANGPFDATGFLQGALKQTAGDHPAVQPWWGSVLENVIIPHVPIFNFLVAWGEFLVGIALILGLFTSFSVVMALTMNFSYLFSGTTSVNPQMVLLSLFLLTAGINASRIGLDRWVLPLISHRTSKEPTMNRNNPAL